MMQNIEELYEECQENINSVESYVNGNRIECGVCKALLLKIRKRPASIVDENSKVIGKLMFPHGVYETKCKHKSKGKYCDTINIMRL